MTSYALLTAPSANRVYSQAAPQLVAAELTYLGQRALDGRLGEIQTRELGGLPYLCFDSDGELSRDELRLLSLLSSAYALFEQVGDLLRPLHEPGLDRYDDDLITIQKYPGKTNEHFTRLLINVTALSTAWAGELLTRRWNVLDPVAGRGTTLNQALMYGWDAVGIEHDGKDVDAYAVFLKTWLKQKRIKHSSEMAPVRREGKRIGRRFEARIGEVRHDPQHLTVFHADTTLARSLLKGHSVDIIVADLPYGVAHGSRIGGGQPRSPQDLLAEALPGWVRLLRPGGALGMSWNTLAAPRDVAADLLSRHGLTVVDGLDGFDHRVDQSVQREILVARAG